VPKERNTNIHMPKPHKCLCGFITIHHRTVEKPITKEQSLNTKEEKFRKI
jgi:hypothetical protein